MRGHKRPKRRRRRKARERAAGPGRAGRARPGTAGGGSKRPPAKAPPNTAQAEQRRRAFAPDSGKGSAALGKGGRNQPGYKHQREPAQGGKQQRRPPGDGGGSEFQARRPAGNWQPARKTTPSTATRQQSERELEFNRRASQPGRQSTGASPEATAPAAGEARAAEYKRAARTAAGQKAAQVRRARRIRRRREVRGCTEGAAANAWAEARDRKPAGIAQKRAGARARKGDGAGRRSKQRGGGRRAGRCSSTDCKAGAKARDPAAQRRHAKAGHAAGAGRRRRWHAPEPWVQVDA